MKRVPKLLSQSWQRAGCLCRLLVAVWVVLAASACTEGPDAAANGKHAEKVLHIDIHAPFGSLNPLDDLISGSGIVYRFLYAHLFVLTSDGRLEPDLALDWAYAPHSKTWTVTIRKDVFFHSGQPVTVDDVDYSLTELTKRAYPHIFASKLVSISISTEDRLDIVLKEDDEEFLKRIWQIPIIPKPRQGDPAGFGRPDGSGPFKYDYRVGDREVGLTANEHDRRGRPSIDRIVFHYTRNSETSWARLLKGETDIAIELTPKDRAMMERYQDRFTFKSRALPYYLILLYNNSDPLFQSPTVRWAMTHAINREYLVKEIVRGFAEPAAGPIFPHSPFKNTAVSAIPYDPERARELLKEDGWILQSDGYLAKDGKYFEFTLLLFEGYQQHLKVGEYLQLCLNDLGIKVRLQTIPYSQLMERYRRNNRFQAVLTEFKGIDKDFQIAQKQWSWSSETPAFAGGFADAEVNRLLDEAAKEQDYVGQRALLQKVEARLIALQPGTFLYYVIATDVMAKRVRVAPHVTLDEANLLAIAFADLE